LAYNTFDDINSKKEEIKKEEMTKNNLYLNCNVWLNFLTLIFLHSLQNNLVGTSKKFATIANAVRWLVVRPDNRDPHLAFAEKLIKASKSVASKNSLASTSGEFKVSQAAREYQPINNKFTVHMFYQKLFLFSFGESFNSNQNSHLE
jgi:hypothetical protein